MSEETERTPDERPPTGQDQRKPEASSDTPPESEISQTGWIALAGIAAFLGLLVNVIGLNLIDSFYVVEDVGQLEIFTILIGLALCAPALFMFLRAFRTQRQIAVAGGDKLKRMLLLLVVVAVSIAAYASFASAATTCSGKTVSPGADLYRVAANAVAGTTFCIQQGTYSVSRPIPVESGDKFIGVYPDLPRPTVTTSQASQVFDALGSDRARIEGVRVQGARATKSCQPNCGRGISGSTNLTVYDVRVTNNENQGIGGTGPGLLVQNSEIDRNGFGDNGAYYAQDGKESAAGLKSVNSLKVVNTYVHDNAWTGVWCDLECKSFEVRGSTLV